MEVAGGRLIALGKGFVCQEYYFRVESLGLRADSFLLFADEGRHEHAPVGGCVELEGAVLPAALGRVGAVRDNLLLERIFE